ncbi:MAG: GDP-mannose 4,6-dehydratase [Anaerolineales bacterium]|jgi:CDP-paratose 2-epimerase
MPKNYLVTGGAGFIGTNYVARLIQRDQQVTIYDNLSREGALWNLQWLRETYDQDAFHLMVGDVRDAALLTSAARSAEVIVHLAGQVAVTTSVVHPREDFESNALGTFNVLEAARLSEKQPVVLYASTNKVYGGMEDVGVVQDNKRYRYAELPYGIPETYPLDFHSPYGCSKGTGDQYVRDYHRIYGLPTVVFRQSCIYGPRQFGVEDQGWLAWFVIAAVMGKQISIYGDGRQVRDVLHVEDLMDAYDSALDHIDSAAGQVFNVGGGPDNTLSIWLEFGSLLEGLLGERIPVTWGDWRPGDQRIYVSDIRRAEQVLGWKPKIDAKSGVQRLFNWVSDNRNLFT